MSSTNGVAERRVELEEEDGWKTPRRGEEKRERKSRCRKMSLQRRMSSAAGAETMETEAERGRDGEIVTHISITMQCQWSVCEASCCLVTVLLRQHQCVFVCVMPTVVCVCVCVGGCLQRSPTAAMSAASINNQRSHPGLFPPLPRQCRDTICSTRWVLGGVGDQLVGLPGWSERIGPDAPP